MPEPSLTNNALTVQPSSNALSNAAVFFEPFSNVSIDTSDILTPTHRGPEMLPSQIAGAEATEINQPRGDFLGKSRVYFAASERFSEEGALLSPARMLANRVLADTPMLNAAVQRGSQVVEAASSVLSQASDVTANITQETAQEMTESTRELMAAAEKAWTAPDNTTRKVLTRQVGKLAERVSGLIKEIDDSDRMEHVRGYVEKASDSLGAIADSLHSGLGYVGSGRHSPANAALDSAALRLKENLVDLRDRNDFEEVFQTAFGENITEQAAKSLVNSFVADAVKPKITVVSAETLQGQAAFGNNTIFVSEQFLNQQANVPEAIDDVLLEEVGHYFDSMLNAADSAGDEGDIFSQLAQGKTLSASQLATLRAEHDHSTIIYDGQTIAVENFWDSFSSSVSDGWDSFSDSASDTWDSVTETASDSWDSFSDSASDTWDSVSDTASDSWDSVSETASDSWDSFSDSASDTWDSVSDTASDSWDSFSDSASDSWDSVSDTASDSWDSFSDSASDTWDSVSDTASDSWDSVSETASDSWDSFSDSASNTWDSVSDTASDSWDSFSDSASDTWSSVTETASNSWDSVSETASDSWDSFSDSASDTWSSVSETASDSWDSFSDSASDTWDSVSNTASDSWDSFTETASNSWDSVSETASDSWDNVTETVSDTYDDVIETYNDVSESVVDTYETVTDTVTDSWNTATETVSDTYDDFTEAAAETWDTFAETTTDFGETIVDTADAVSDYTLETLTDAKDATFEWIAENESTVNRVVGGVQTVGGIGETALGVVMIPTGAATFGTTSVLGAGVAAHGVDTTWAGLKTLWTGEAQETYTQQGITAVADAVPGVSTETAESIGMWGDIGIGIVGPAGAARALTSSADNIVAGVADDVTEGIVGAADDVATGTADNIVAGVADDVTADVVGAADSMAAGSIDNAADSTDAIANEIPDFTFRGDTRGPDEIFNSGFEPRGTETDLLSYARDNTPSVYVGTSTSSDVATDFATGGGTREGFVYAVDPKNGVDVNQALGSSSPYPLELEIVVPGSVQPSDIRGVTPVTPAGEPALGYSVINPGYRK